MKPYHICALIFLLTGCGPQGTGTDGPGQGAEQDAGAADTGGDADCCAGAVYPSMEKCSTWQCVAGACVITPVAEGTLCGGVAADSMHGECTCGFCSWANYGADPCTKVPDTLPCRNGRGICFDGGCETVKVCAAPPSPAL